MASTRKQRSAGSWAYPESRKEAHPTVGAQVPEKLDGAEGAKASAEPLDGEVLEPDFRPSAKHQPLDIGAVIADALRHAGLLKNG